MNNTQKKSYNAPRLTEVGSFEDVTQATKKGNVSDVAWPSQTPISVILSSNLS